MAKAKVTVTKKRVRKSGKGTGYKKCSNCGGDGVVKIRRKRRKK